MGVPYPQLPEAARQAAECIANRAERDEEYQRLERKYGPRNPTANGNKARGRHRLSTPALTR